MSFQTYFNYKFNKKTDEDNFFVNNTNIKAYDVSISAKFDQSIFLYGPEKSGKSHLSKIWQKINNAIIYNNFSEGIKTNSNIIIDDVFKFVSEEELFHLINHCNLSKLKMFLTSSTDINNYTFKIKDLLSRLKEFHNVSINLPDDEMCKMLMTKLFSEKQIIIKNKEIFDFIFNRITRSYNEIFIFVDKLDKLSLEKKRQLTIPLIKEII